MKISIITVCKNAEDTIENTILSVINQTSNNIEFIIIDGVSTDNTISIIEKYRNKISYFISEQDTGIYNAMNKGIKAASGDILYFLNANDYIFDKEVISRVVQKFEKTNNDIVFGSLVTIDGENINIEKNVGNIDKIYFMNGDNVCHQCIFYKSKLFKDFGLYDEGLKIAADYDFNLKTLIQNKKKYLIHNEPVVKFTLGGFSTSEKYRKLLLEEREIVKNRYFSSSELKLNKFINKNFRSLVKNSYVRKVLSFFI